MKKTLSLLCAVALLLSLGLPALAVEYGAELNPNEKTYTQRFSDVPTNHWAFQYVGELVERGAINGYPDGKFYPDKIVTREEFAKIMVVAAGLSVTPVNYSSYADVDTTYWASPFIETAKPYMTAYQESWGMCFHPTDGALREDIAVAVVKLKGYDTRLADLSIIRTMFSDVDGISAAAQPYVALAVENGIISGYVDGTFRGQATITRSEAAAMLWRAFQYGNDNKVIASEASPAPSASPTPSAKPSASPTPTPKPSPSPSPKPTLPPEPTEAPKPFVAETVVKNVKVSNTNTMMTMDDDSNLIFYNENTDQIVSLDPDTDRTRVLLDVSTATCEMPVEGQTASLAAAEDEETADNSDANAPDDQETQPPEGTGEPEEPSETEPEPEPEPAPPATITYEDLTVNQVFWDDVAHRLLVVGEFAKVRGTDDGWNIPNKDDSLSGVFALENEEMTHLSKSVDQIYCALSDGSFVVGYYPEIFDLSTNSVIQPLFDFGSMARYRTYSVFQHNSDIYLCLADHYNGDRCLYVKYDYGTGQLKYGYSTISECHTYAKGAIYTWVPKLIQAVRPTDAATQDKLNPSKDVEIKDLRPLPTDPSNLRVTSDEQYLFYDSSASAIRVIRPNPNA